ncbi:hypothetical protein BJI67_08650 [Acidihalobacter aeolianus]|uniref:VTT domain-containing protein n=1 Tax=Acidihalobacter aeolianus TaxID=2792603 RepID=A0A1D8K824_9GAMM|nr:DedA family protein [Acidihalobacter aeolianus]AOV17117.1 hypothetical protein BJI67_08650 [Acidihalobacter aeolianus]
MSFLDQSLRFATPYLDSYGYFAIMFAVMLEGIGIPAPGLTLVVAASVLAGRGDMDLSLVFISALAAALAGYNIGYQLGNLGGRRLLLRTRLINRHHLRRMHRLYVRWGAWIVIVAPFVDGLRQLNGPVAGMLGMPRIRFVPANAFGCFVWCAVWCLLPYALSEHLGTLLSILGQLRPYLLLAAVGLLALLAAYLLNQRGNREDRS